MTDKKDTKLFKLGTIGKVPDKRNTSKINLTMTKFWFPGYSAYMEDYEKKYSEEVSIMLEKLALTFDSSHLWLFDGVYERFLASKIGEDYTDMMLDPDIYKKHIMICIPSKLTYKMFYKDILYVYDDGRVLVASSPECKRAFRDIRNII